MPKKEIKNNLPSSINILKISQHPALTHKRTFGQKASDLLTSWMGSWTFLLFFTLFILVWICINTFFLISYTIGKPWDPYPFILLNLALSCLAAIQAPIILMSQNREAQKDRLKVQYDYAVNRKALNEIQGIKEELKRLNK